MNQHITKGKKISVIILAFLVITILISAKSIPRMAVPEISSPFAEMELPDITIEIAREIPKYTEARWSRFMTSESNDDSMENIIYKINLETKQPEELRKWNLQKENGNITLWDCQKNQLIYEGQAALNSEGNLLNEEYYLHLLWDYYYRPNDYTEDFTVYVPLQTNMKIKKRF